VADHRVVVDSQRICSVLCLMLLIKVKIQFCRACSLYSVVVSVVRNGECRANIVICDAGGVGKPVQSRHGTY